MDNGFCGLIRIASDGSWRKRAGVEPTQTCLTGPAGFEDRPPHRGTISSLVIHCPVQSAELPRRTAQDVSVAHAASVADTVEEFENVDRHFAPATDFIA